MRNIYTILFYLILPVIFLRLYWRSRKLPAYRERWKERLGFIPLTLKQCIWVHAVSVGETLAAIPLIKALKKKYPDLPIVVTNMTPTGAERVQAALGESVSQVYIPYDLPAAVNRFLASINPKIAIVMETELWPNLFYACYQRQIPMIVTNARLSEKSAKGYAKIAFLTREMFLAITYLAVQAQADAKRFIELGFSADKMHVTGNMKFDLELPADLSQKIAILLEQLGKDRLIWIAASTHPSEEEMMLAAHRLILAKHPSALLILVPRHPDRFDAVAELVKQQGFRLARRSHQDPCMADTTVYLGDTMGELLLLYGVSTVAFVAGSFVSVGGHNMLEAAALHKPILTGPVLFNFSEISQMLITAQGMMVVKHVEALAEKVNFLFSHPDSCQEIGEKAYQVVHQNRGSLQKQLSLIDKCMLLSMR